MGFQKPEPKLGHSNLVGKNKRTNSSAKLTQRGTKADLAATSHIVRLAFSLPPASLFTSFSISLLRQIAWHYSDAKTTPFSLFAFLQSHFPLPSFLK